MDDDFEADERGDDPYLAAHAGYAAARARGTVASTGPASWIAVGRDAAAAAMREVTTFVGSIGGGDGPPDEQILQWIPEPRHGKVRRVVNGVIAPHRLQAMEPFLRETARGLLADALRADGPVDLVAAFVDAYPTRALAHLFGVPPGDAEVFRRLSDEFLARQGVIATGSTVAQVHPDFTRYVDDLVATRRAAAEPPDDLITRFIEADIEGERLSDVAIRTQMIMLIIAGNETTRNLLGNIVATLVSTPALYARFRDDLSLADAVIEESLRVDAPVQLLVRKCAHATTLGDTALAEGDQVVVSIAAANRDERYYACPDAFDVDRAAGRDHLAFGTGPHVCPGASLARLEARVALQEIAAAVRSMRRVPDRSIEHNPVLWARGLRSLWVELEPAGPAGEDGGQ